ncbi:MAG: Asp-tRNA(Asn)/Glu-tRNA(Gln) amidotransferase subunit GatB [Planctomycetota bacterium]|jgi:aspartyl-tRNA(Asn)/glutamyl-tRNA(Gln) amidotransferase subunit B
MADIASARLKIGMEIHVELATLSKMFSRAANVAHPDHYDAGPNTLIDPLVAALPGVLPVMNRQAVEMAMMVGLALDCTIAGFSKWDRKNYFYPDLPKGYQISQYDLPLCFDGELLISGADGSTKRVGIVRAHLEEDAGKLGHELPGGKPYDGSLVDLNRAGTPLLEIVTHPDLECAEDAVTFGKELRNICRFLGVSEGVMQRGHMRFEPNINVIIDTGDGREYATPIVEIKNLNSFRALRAAIEHEHERQVDAWQADGITAAPGRKSTRGWDDSRQVTVLQREKEEAHDYRYFPDPDLVPVVVDEAWRRDVATRIPELPMHRRARYEKQYDLPAKDAAALTDERDLCLFFEQCIDAYHTLAASEVPIAHPGLAGAKLLLNAGARRANEQGCGIHELGINPRQVAQIIELRDGQVIGSSAADELFGLLCETDDDASVVAEQRGLVQVRDEGQLDRWCDEAVRAQPQAAEDFRGGKDAALGRLVGEVMKLSRSQADAKAIREKLVEQLRE